MALAVARQSACSRAGPATSRPRCVKVSAVNKLGNAPAFIASAAASALLLCSPVFAAPIYSNPVSEVAGNPKGIKTDNAIESQKSANPNKIPGALPPGPPSKDRPAAYARGEGQTNCPCPPGALPHCPCN